jgi:hypothetical protein
VPADIRGYGPGALAPESAWQPATALSPPPSPEPPREGARLNPPVAVREQPRAATPAPAAPQRGGPSFPVGIPQFAKARENVAAGLRPLIEGWDWLQANRYRTVLNVKLPGEDDSSDRAIVQRHGMKYLSIEVSPATLSRAVVDRFSRIMDDPNNHPLFVYDKTGILAGGLWYLYFRLAENHTDEAARVLAGRLGLHEIDADNRDMWLAIQKLLGERPR